MTENQQLSVEAYFCFIFLLYICYLHICTIYPKRVIISSTHSQLYPFNKTRSKCPADADHVTDQRDHKVTE